MLFDLRGRRRRVVQVVYLMLALLLGGGLVLFGIGGDVSGGLVDAFRGGGGGQSTDSALEDRVDRQEERLRANPRDERVLQNLVRDYYSLAVSQRESGTVGFPEDARDAVSYLNLVRIATRAGDKRTADLAGQKAIELAPKAQKKAIRQEVKTL